METSNKTSQRVANLVAFSDGTIRRPESAILLPNQHTVLCRAGLNLGASALISRREANRKGIKFLYPAEYGVQDEKIYLYSNKEARDSKGKYVGEYIGHQFDSFSGMLTTEETIFIRKDRELFKVNIFGEIQQISAEELVGLRLNHTEEKSSGVESRMDVIKRLAKESPMVLKAALELQKLETFNPQTWEERCHTAAYGHILKNKMCRRFPKKGDVERLEACLLGLSEEDLTRFEKGEMSLEELNSTPKAISFGRCQNAAHMYFVGQNPTEAPGEDECDNLTSELLGLSEKDLTRFEKGEMSVEEVSQKRHEKKRPLFRSENPLAPAFIAEDEEA